MSRLEAYLPLWESRWSIPIGKYVSETHFQRFSKTHPTIVNTWSMTFMRRLSLKPYIQERSQTQTMPESGVYGIIKNTTVAALEWSRVPLVFLMTLVLIHFGFVSLMGGAVSTSRQPTSVPSDWVLKYSPRYTSTHSLWPHFCTSSSLPYTSWLESSTCLDQP